MHTLCHSGRACFMELHFIGLPWIILFFFNKWEVCGNPVLSKSTGAIFPLILAHSVCLCHILAILSRFQRFSLWFICYWSSMVVLWVQDILYSYKAVNLINACVLTALPTTHSPIFLSLSLQPPYSLRHNITETMPIKNPTIASKYTSERNSHTSRP